MKTSIRARGILLSILVGILLVGVVSAEKVRDKIPKNPREWVEPGQSMHQFMWAKYLLFVPKDYGKTDKKYPCILYLHGAGQKGNNPNNLRVVALNAQLTGKKKATFPFIVISPQLPGPAGFEIPYSLDRGLWYYDEFFEVCDKMLDHLMERYAIDETRLYCVGASMGGFGTWEMAIKYPNRFAAIAPLCGEGNPDKVCAVKDIPVYVFHCEDDEVMPVKGSDIMVDALKACGGNVEYVRQKGGDHMACWSNEFDDLYKWLLKHTKTQSSGYDASEDSQEESPNPSDSSFEPE